MAPTDVEETQKVVGGFHDDCRTYRWQLRAEHARSRFRPYPRSARDCGAYYLGRAHTRTRTRTQPHARNMTIDHVTRRVRVEKGGIAV